MMTLPGAQSNLDIALYDGSGWKYRTKAAPSGVLSRGKKYELYLNAEGEGWTEGTGTIASYFVDSRDDNQYSTVTIGSQVWMVKNLAYLPSVASTATDPSTTACYYVYGYNGTDVETAKATANYTTYGVLYNWLAAMAGSTSSSANPSGVQGICPDGWHLPGDAEWTQLETYLANNGYNYDGSTGPVSGSGVRDKIAKSLASENGWTTSSIEGSPGNTEDDVEYINKSGFTALPGGMRYSNGLFYNIGSEGFWRSSTQTSSSIALYRLLRYNYSNVSRYQNEKANGLSVRCLRD
jgi:uncharacterized protein (TIGR02145 family)